VLTNRLDSPGVPALTVADDYAKGVKSLKSASLRKSGRPQPTGKGTCRRACAAACWRACCEAHLAEQ